MMFTLNLQGNSPKHSLTTTTNYAQLAYTDRQCRVSVFNIINVIFVFQVTSITQFLIENCCEIFGEKILTLLGDPEEELGHISGMDKKQASNHESMQCQIWRDSNPYYISVFSIVVTDTKILEGLTRLKSTCHVSATNNK